MDPASPAPLPSRSAQPVDASRTAHRWALIREVVVFSAKVALETARDLILLPAALLAGLVGVLAGGERPGEAFEIVRRAGARFDAWLNLFGEHDGRPGPVLDDQIRRLESLLVAEAARGGITAQAKATIDHALDTLQHGSRRTSDSGEEKDIDRTVT